MKKISTDYLNFPSQKGDAVAPAKPKTQGSLAIVRKSEEENCPFRSLIREWLDYCRDDGLSKKTLTDYGDKVFKFWWWWDKYYAAELGAHPENVTVKQARAFASYLREEVAFRWGITTATNNKFQQSKKLSQASIAAYGRAVKVFFNWLEREGYIDKTPFNKSVKFANRHKQDKIIKVVEDEAMQKIFAHLGQSERRSTYAGSRNLALVALLYDTGMRRGEILGLALGDVELDHRRCKIKDGKSGSRWVFFGAEAQHAIGDYLARHRLVQDETPGSPLWLTVDGSPLTYGGFGVMIARLDRATGVDFHAHLLRHTAATQLIAEGMNVFQVKEILGHASITTTQIYVHQNPEQLAAAYRTRSPLAQLVATDASLNTLKRGRGRPKKVQEE